MDDSLLNTKLYIPPVPPELVSRPHLIERFNAGLHRKLTVISAPAGFGKTTLLTEWSHLEADDSSNRAIAWLSLDTDDNDPNRFWLYFIAALQTIQPTIGERCQSMLQSPSPPPTKSILTILINEISSLSRTVVLILDDFHVIVSQQIQEDIGFLLDHLPPQIRLIISSRMDPALPLASLRGRGQLSELRTADLRFTPDETSTFLNTVMALGLSDESVTALGDRTEGWIASLQMAAISMQGREDISDFIRDFSGTHHYIMDYLTEEVLQRQESNTRSFLLRTSILERLSGPLCDAVTARGDSQGSLDQLAASNLFLVPLDDDRRWFCGKKIDDMRWLRNFRFSLEFGHFSACDGRKGGIGRKFDNPSSVYCQKRSQGQKQYY